MRLLAAVAVAAALALAGCGGSDTPTLRVSAAASLKDAFDQYGAHLDGAKAAFSFAGSDELAAQIRQGARPDVFASANTKLPDQLYAAHLVDRPVVFAANRLVLAVPAGGKVHSLAGAAGSDVKLAIGAASVPIGSYTREVLARLGAARSRAILANVRSNEPDVKSIVAKLTQGAVDAGFVYVTDVDATHGKLKAIELPPSVQPRVAYAAAVVKGSGHARQAAAFVDGLVTGSGQAALRAAGFDPPPKRSP